MEYSNETGYPSVTDILSPWVDTQWFKPIHAKRGDAIHGAVKLDLQGMFVPSLPPAWQIYVDSYYPFKKHIVEIIGIEERLISQEEGYCGQYDLLARMDERFHNAIALLDWKSSQAKYSWWKPQLGGYANLIIKKKGISPDIAISARLRKDPGKKILIDVYDKNDIQHFMHWFNAARVCHQNFK